MLLKRGFCYRRSHRSGSPLYFVILHTMQESIISSRSTYSLDSRDAVIFQNVPLLPQLEIITVQRVSWLGLIRNITLEHDDRWVLVAVPKLIYRIISYDLITVNLRFSGNQGTEHFFPLLPKSAVATWSFHEKHDEPRDKGIVISKVIHAMKIESRDRKDRLTGTD